jgi:hypothetical protein
MVLVFHQLVFAVMPRLSTGKAATHFWSAALGPSRTNMADPKQPSRKHYEEHYPLVMQRAGLTKSDDLESVFDDAIRAIFNSYWAARNQLTIAGYQDVLKQYAKGQAMVREALRLLGPIHSEISFAVQLHDMPEPKREDEISRYLSFRAQYDHLTPNEIISQGDALLPTPDLDAMISERDQGIYFLKDNPDMLARLLRRQPDDYRKDPETALVIEPALDLLERIGFRQSRKLTRKAFFDALFDLIGIDANRRPKHRRVDVIASNRHART